MKLEKHILISASVAAGHYIFTKSAVDSLIIFSSGVLIDCDHILDYIIEEKPLKGSFKFHLKNIFDKFYNYKMTKAYILLHSYEVLIGLYLLNYFFSFIKLILLGFFVHIFSDIINGGFKTILSYSFLYRLFVGFEFDKLFIRNKKP